MSLALLLSGLLEVTYAVCPASEWFMPRNTVYGLGVDQAVYPALFFLFWGFDATTPRGSG